MSLFGEHWRNASATQRNGGFAQTPTSYPHHQ